MKGKRDAGDSNYSRNTNSYTPSTKLGYTSSVTQNTSGQSSAIVPVSQGSAHFYGGMELLPQAAKHLGFGDTPRPLVYGGIWSILALVTLFTPGGWPAGFGFAILLFIDASYDPEKAKQQEEADFLAANPREAKRRLWMAEQEGAQRTNNQSRQKEQEPSEETRPYKPGPKTQMYGPPQTIEASARAVEPSGELNWQQREEQSRMVQWTAQGGQGGLTVNKKDFEEVHSELPEDFQWQDAIPVKPSNAEEYAEILNIVSAPLSLIYGPAGTGKTTMVQAIAAYCVSKGWTVVVADPDYRKGEWPNLPVFGKAGNYWQCNDLLKTAMNLCDRRYQERAEKGTSPEEFKPVLILLEEFTNWSSECPSSAKFILKAAQKFRKANMHGLIVSHGNTLTATGNARGLAETFKNGTVQLALKAQRVLIGGEYKNRSSGVGFLSELGANPTKIKIPDFRQFNLPKIPDLSNLNMASVFDLSESKVAVKDWTDENKGNGLYGDNFYDDDCHKAFDRDADIVTLEDVKAVKLPKGVSEEVSEKMFEYVFEWLDGHKGKLPIAQSHLVSKTSTSINKVYLLLGKDRWIQMLKYWNGQGRIALTGGEGSGFKVDLPSTRLSESEILISDIDF